MIKGVAEVPKRCMGKGTPSITSIDNSINNSINTPFMNSLNSSINSEITRILSTIPRNNNPHRRAFLFTSSLTLSPFSLKGTRHTPPPSLLSLLHPPPSLLSPPLCRSFITQSLFHHSPVMNNEINNENNNEKEGEGAHDMERGEECSIGYVTISTMEKAEELAKHLLNKRLIACANIVGKVKSVYWWEGKVCSEEEQLLILKTRSSLAPSLIAEVKANHPYDLPEIIFSPISHGNPPYLHWILSSTSPPPPSSSSSSPP